MGFFQKIINGLKKTKQAIGFKLNELFQRGIFDEDFYEELEFILLGSDVGAQTTEEIIETLRERMSEDKISDTKQAQKYLRQVMLDILGDEKLEVEPPCVILVAGVNGVGKTTTIGKLASRYKAEGKSVILAAADTFRAAAIDQLDVWAERAGVDIVKHKEGADPAAVIFDTISAAKARGTEIIICDTAGRLHNKKNLMEELGKIYRVIDRELPYSDREVLLVLDATTGQNAVNQAREFAKIAEITGIILTKLDGTAKGGVVIGISDRFHIPVRYIGIGEGIDQLKMFDRKEFVRALFGDEQK